MDARVQSAERSDWQPHPSYDERALRAANTIVVHNKWQKSLWVGAYHGGGGAPDPRTPTTPHLPRGPTANS